MCVCVTLHWVSFSPPLQSTYDQANKPFVCVIKESTSTMTSSALEEDTLVMCAKNGDSLSYDDLVDDVRTGNNDVRHLHKEEYLNRNKNNFSCLCVCVHVCICACVCVCVCVWACLRTEDFYIHKLDSVIFFPVSECDSPSSKIGINLAY